MSELEYKICQIIKTYYLEKKENPDINSIARRIYCSREGTRYHLKKLIKLGIVEKTNDRKYKLLVTNVK